MDQEIKKKWVAALRSGDYIQGNQVLCRKLPAGNKYCCMGVLCEVLGVKKSYYDGTRAIYDNNQSWFLPDSVVEKLGFQSSNPKIRDTTLSNYNDRLGWNFNQIADLIESSDL